MLEPQINQWYKTQETLTRFEILAVRDDFIIVQLENGSIEEYSLEQWEEMAVLPIDPASSSWSMSWAHDQDVPHAGVCETEEELDNDYYELSADFLDDDFNEMQDY